MRTPASLRLETLKGPRRGRVSAASPSDAPEKLPDPVRLLSDSLGGRWSKFRKRFLATRKARRPAEIDASVHDLRTASRRLMSSVEAAAAFAGPRRARKLRDRVHRVLGACGDLRDLTVQKALASDIVRLNGFERELERAYAKEARRLRGRLRRDDLRAIRRGVRALSARLGRRGADAGGRVWKPARRSFKKVRRTRRALDPTDVASIHRLRVALKNFRYLMEELHPALPAVGPEDVETLHTLQTTMGDLHDLELLSARLAKHGRPRPGEVAPAVEELEVRHNKMLRSFLRAVDPILAFWTNTLARKR